MRKDGTPEIFRRYERKYILSERQYLELMCSLAVKMGVDGYGKHTICNIYFDTPDFRLIRASLEKPEYKEKLRLRSYGIPGDGDQVYVELKKKLDGVVYKRRMPMELGEAMGYLYRGIRPVRDGQVLREVDYVMRRYGLLPKAHLSYDRIAFCGNDDPELRVTFDTNLRARRYALDLSRGNYGSLILPEGRLLMEVKIPGSMPVWMSRLFSRLGIFPASFSKYGAYYRQSIAAVEEEGGKSCA